jgi:hypothetical protein
LASLKAESRQHRLEQFLAERGFRFPGELRRRTSIEFAKTLIGRLGVLRPFRKRPQAVIQIIIGEKGAVVEEPF